MNFIKKHRKLFTVLAVIAVILSAGAITTVKFALPYVSQIISEKLGEDVEIDIKAKDAAQIGKLFTDKGFRDFVSGFNAAQAKDLVGFMDDLNSEVNPEPTSEPTQESVNTEAPAPVATPSTAKERIYANASSQDIADGTNILAKIDMGYVSSLTSGGLTAEEKAELKTYVKSVLSSAEISRALELYNQYSKYL